MGVLRLGYMRSWYKRLDLDPIRVTLDGGRLIRAQRLKGRVLERGILVVFCRHSICRAFRHPLCG